MLCNLLFILPCLFSLFIVHSFPFPFFHSICFYFSFHLAVQFGLHDSVLSPSDHPFRSQPLLPISPLCLPTLVQASLKRLAKPATKAATATKAAWATLVVRLQVLTTCCAPKRRATTDPEDDETYVLSRESAVSERIAASWGVSRPSPIGTPTPVLLPPSRTESVSLAALTHPGASTLTSLSACLPACLPPCLHASLPAYYLPPATCIFSSHTSIQSAILQPIPHSLSLRCPL
jgi:hypothetical protein